MASFSQKLISFLSIFSGLTAYSIIIGILLICGFGIPIPEDITLLAAGLLAGLGNIHLTGAFLAGFIGVLMGDSILFFLGRKLGYRAFKLPVFRKIFTEKRIQKSREKILNNSKFICFTARFLPGLRSPIFLTAGIMGVNPLIFIFLDFLASLLSIPLWIMLGWWFGRQMSTNPEAIEQALVLAKKFNAYIFLTLFAFVGTYIYWKKKKTNSPTSHQL
ncbi:MAG: DedA family protein [Bdellovibrio sp.]|nr:MAG: DedA family protein [Bdellovibrio sp.]